MARRDSLCLHSINLLLLFNKKNIFSSSSDLQIVATRESCDSEDNNDVVAKT